MDAEQKYGLRYTLSKARDALELAYPYVEDLERQIRELQSDNDRLTEEVKHLREELSSNHRIGIYSL